MNVVKYPQLPLTVFIEDLCNNEFLKSLLGVILNFLFILIFHSFLPISFTSINDCLRQQPNPCFSSVVFSLLLCPPPVILFFCLCRSNWEISIHIHTPPCVKRTACGNPLWSTGSSALVLCDDLEGGRGWGVSRRAVQVGGICVCVYDSLHCELYSN